MKDFLNMVVYRRVLLKVSGELLMGNNGAVHDLETVQQIATDIKEVFDLGVELSLVVGGGNIYRGEFGSFSIDRTRGDHIGMLATLINALVLQTALEDIGVQSKVLSAFNVFPICETYSKSSAVKYLEEGKIIIFACGTGNPYFTTDTASVLRALEVGCDIIMKGTNVDGIYTDDPNKNPLAKKVFTILYDDVIRMGLKVMDATAFALAREHSLPLCVFPLNKKGAFVMAINADVNFSYVS